MTSSRLFVAAIAAGMGLSTTASADVLVTEFMPNPSGSDAEREWIELYNTGTEAVDLSNYKIGTSETAGDNEDMNQFPAGSLIGPGEVLLFAVQAAPFQEFFGVQADFETVDTDPSVPEVLAYPTWSGNPNTFLALANGGDQVLLLDGSDTIVDYVSYGGEEMPAPGTNESWERVFASDADTTGTWVLRTDGEFTPGVASVAVPEPTSLALLGLGGLSLLRRRRA